MGGIHSQNEYTTIRDRLRHDLSACRSDLSSARSGADGSALATLSETIESMLTRIEAGHTAPLALIESLVTQVESMRTARSESIDHLSAQVEAVCTALSGVIGQVSTHTPAQCPPSHEPRAREKNDAGVTLLSQATFEKGTLFITEPGHYALCEDIVFDYVPATQLLPNGFIDPDFTGNADSARANIGIAICCDNVTIDGCGFSMQQSARASTHNRVFTTIECSGINLSTKSGKPRTCPVLVDPDQGGSRYYGNNNKSFGGGGPQETNPDDTDEFYDDTGPPVNDTLLATYKNVVGSFADVGCENITIKNLTFGRSSHFGVHGTDNRGLYIQDCKFFEFEVAAIWLNNPIRPVLQRLDIVGMQEFPQTLSQLGAFRTQGTGLKGIVNAAYWGIILNQNFGGVGIVFPQPSGGTLPDFESGKSTQKQDRKNPSKGVATEGGINKQNIGARNALIEDVNIAQLQSQMITGVVLGRQKKDESYVPILFSNDTKAEIGGGGHSGYTAKDRLVVQAIDDYGAFYDNDVCARWYVCRLFGNPAVETCTHMAEYAKLFDGDSWPNDSQVTFTNQDGKEVPLYPGKDHDIDEEEDNIRKKRALLEEYMTTRLEPQFKPENKLRLADRAIWWKDGEEGKPRHNEYHQGLVQYRGLDPHGDLVTDSDKFVYVFSNNYKEGHGMINAPYPTSKVHDYSHPDDVDGDYDHDGCYLSTLDRGNDGKFLNKVYRAAVVLPVVNDMIRNHCGPDTGEPWWVSRNMDHQNTPGMPVDFGGHEMNGVVSMHFDRMWGGILRNCTIVNARNLKDPDYVHNTHNMHEMREYPLQLGFSASSWGIMMNDSGGNIVQNCNTLNMLARTGASFAMHNAFGSRGNLWENCRAMSCAGGAMWGFVADKGAAGNIFRKCETSNIVGSTAAAGFVVRGNGNLLEDCKALDTRVVLTDAQEAHVRTRLDSIPYAASVVAGFLLDDGGSDEDEYKGRTLGNNVLRNCEVLKVGLETEYHVDRNSILLYKNTTDDTEKKEVQAFLDGITCELTLNKMQRRLFVDREALKIPGRAHKYTVDYVLQTNQESNTICGLEKTWLYNRTCHTYTPGQGVTASPTEPYTGD